MNGSKQHPGFSRTVIALAVLAAFSPAHAEEGGDIAQLTAPGSSVSVGVGIASGDSKDRALFGLYNGLRTDDTHGLLGLSYLNHGDATTGIWTTFEGRNLGLDNRELSFTQQQPGDWKYSLGYSELVRHDPRTINTGLVGAGSTTPTVVRLAAPGTGSELNLDLKRKSFTLGGEKWFGGSLLFDASFKSEDKDGARLFGRGFTCPSGAAPSPTCTTMGAGINAWALLMLPEPINSNIKQAEARLNFSSGNLMLNGGYYGSFYSNSNGTLTPTVPGILNNPLGAATALNAGLQGILQLPMALPPDNQAHQFYLSGNYRFTPTTRATFKYAYTHATQNDDFLGKGLAGAPAGISNLGGVVDTNLAQFGLTARPMPKLSLLANVRYEDKNDSTPIALYNIEGANTFTNGHNSHRKLNAKLEGSYQLPDGYRATLGVDYDTMDRGIPVSTTEIAGITALRQKTEELGWRGELRRAMSETFTGAIGYASARRNGSDYTRLVAGFPVVNEATLVALSSATSIVVPAMLMDRTRDKVKLSANWTPTQRLSLQFMVEEGKDSYSGPTPRGTATVAQPTKGLRDTGVTFFSVDAAYVVTDALKLTAYASHGNQTLHVNHSTGYMADLSNRNDTVGVGLVGKPSGRLQLGGDLMYINDTSVYDQTMSPGASAANIAFLNANGLPDVTFRQLRLKLFGQYAVHKNAFVRVDAVHQRSYLNEWTWGYNGVPFAYSDNTTIGANQNQNVTFVGVSYIYKFK